MEVAKNLILAGVKSVTLYDPTPVTYYDLSAQFYLTEADVGKPRAAASVQKLADLNQYVHVTEAQGPLDEAFITRSDTQISRDTNTLMRLWARLHMPFASPLSDAHARPSPPR